MDSKAVRMLRRPEPSSLLEFGLAAFWLLNGASKMWMTLADRPAQSKTWLGAWPPGVEIAIITGEVLIGFGLIAGFRRFSFGLALAGTSAASTAWLLWPPKAGQECGCGIIKATGTTDALAILALLAALHLLCFVMTMPRSLGKTQQVPLASSPAH